MQATMAARAGQQRLPLTHRSSCRGCRSAPFRAPCCPEADVSCRLCSGEAVSPENGEEVGFNPVQIPNF